MEDYRLDIQIRWSDLDANFHLRHSVYYDYGALCRVHFLNEHALNAAAMQRLKIGPILFREEALFKKEIRSEDKLFMTLKLIKAKKDFSRWSIQHQLYKNDNMLSAIITVDGAWMNMVERKLATPPEEVFAAFNGMPKGDDFAWI
jgi:acyl-CoA thioester hydrolase